MSPRLEATLSATVTVCAIIIAGTLLYQQLSPSPGPGLHAGFTPEDAWEELLQHGDRLGPERAPVQIVEFGDFQCPFCRAFHVAVRDAMEEMPGQISLTYLHFPLTGIHRVAEPAAWAAECARQQGRLGPMMDDMFAKQDSLGQKPWNAFAQAAGVPDTTAFSTCLEEDTTQERIQGHVRLGARVGVSGTPTIILNGWRLEPPPPPTTVVQYARDILAGRSPFPDG